MSLDLTGLRTWRAGVAWECEPALGLGAGDGSPTSHMCSPEGHLQGELLVGLAGCEGSSSVATS